MKRQNLRVIIASEYPDVQYLLRGVIEERGGAVVVGQSQDVCSALALAKDLRPDVAIIDCYLPHIAELEKIPLSRMGGLDVAQTILEEFPKTKVILLNNLDIEFWVGHNLSLNVNTVYSIMSKEADITPVLLEDGHELIQPGAPVFASVVVQPRVLPNPRRIGVSDKAVFFGSLTIMVGWLLTITMVLAPAGVPLALVGVVSVLFGLTVKLVASLRRRLFEKRGRLEEG